MIPLRSLALLLAPACDEGILRLRASGQLEPIMQRYGLHDRLGR